LSPSHPKEKEKIFLGEVSKKLPMDIQRTARCKLLYLDDAGNLHDLQSVPGNQCGGLAAIAGTL
jgi:proteic killer suppression protein